MAISSDFIVGFCGETEEQFQRTCDLVRTAGFKNSFIFKYSPRPGTKADELHADDVPEEVKKRRNNELLALQNAVSLADHRDRVGQTVAVLAEGPSKNFLKNGQRGRRPGTVDRPHHDGSHRRLRGQPAPDRPERWRCACARRRRSPCSASG